MRIQFESIVMVMSNKVVLNAIELPMTFLLMQMLFAVVMLRVCAATGWMQVPKLTWRMTRKLSPLILVNVVGLSLNTLCLQYVDASFYQVESHL